MEQLELHHLKHRRVFITGASGMIGSHLTQTLMAKGANVVALIRDFVPHSYLLTNVKPLPTCVFGDLQDYRLLERTIAEYEISVVFHLGAQTIVPIANTSPIGTFKTNIEGSWNLLEACRHNPSVKAIVMASSDKAYGQSPTLPYTEETPLRGEYPYDVSKSCTDLIARTYWKTYSLPVAITRCGNVFGPGDLNFSRIVPGTIRSALRKERPIIRSDGSLLRDYFYVKDAMEAYLWTAEKLLDDSSRLGGEAFNFSNEHPMSVLEITRLILEVMKCPDLEPIVLGTTKGEIQEQSLSAKKAKEVLGWSSRYSLEEGLTQTIRFLETIIFPR